MRNEPRAWSNAPPVVRMALRPTGLSELQFVSPLGSGRRCTVWRAKCGSDLVAVKLFSSEAIAKHASRHREPLARFEFNRNRRLYAVPGLRSNIVRPLRVFDLGSRQMLMQDVICGHTLTEFSTVASGRDRRQVYAQLEQIVTAAHDVSIFDLDLHRDNILITRSRTGHPNVMLFDFNKIPFHEHPPNALAGILVRLGLIGPRSRGLRLLRLLGRALA